MKKNILVNINKGNVCQFLTTMNSLSQNNKNSEFDVYITHCNLEESDKEYIKIKVADIAILV